MVFGNLINIYLVSSKKKLIGSQKKFVKVAVTLYSSTIDPLLIHLLCPLEKLKENNYIYFFLPKTKFSVLKIFKRKNFFLQWLNKF